MSQEQDPELSPTLPTTDPYTTAFAIGNLLLEFFQARGEMRKPSEITDEWEQDEHFDQLSRLHCQVCELMGLAWPPPVRVPADDIDIS